MGVIKNLILLSNRQLFRPLLIAEELFNILIQLQLDLYFHTVSVQFKEIFIHFIFFITALLLLVVGTAWVGKLGNVLGALRRRWSRGGFRKVLFVYDCWWRGVLLEEVLQRGIIKLLRKDSVFVILQIGAPSDLGDM